jgi:hypothetical protein
VSVDSRLHGPRAVVSLIHFHEIVKTMKVFLFHKYVKIIVKILLSGRPFIMTTNAPDPPKSVKSFMRLCFLKKV